METPNNKDCVVSLIFIDNYNEVLESIEEVRRPLLVAFIDRKINSLAQQLTGIVRKFESDKYFMIFTYDKLAFLKETKFNILDSVREIDMGNKIPVTLSIGIGLMESTLSQGMEFARAAIDLALGRGGDQVIIKDVEKFYFFGGKTKEVGYNTRVRARVKSYALSELIEEAGNVMIMGHKNPDLDCLGSAIGVSKIVFSHGKKCNIVLNQVSSSIRPLYDRLMNQKDFNKAIFVDTKKALPRIKDTTLLIIVDTHRPSYVEEYLILEKAKNVVVIDHHRKSAEFIENPVLSYHEPYASSTSELVTEMFLYVKNKITLLPVEADALLSGITIDTKNFAFKTGAKTFEAAAYLKRSGADSIRVRLLLQNDFDSYKAMTDTVNDAEIYHGCMAIATCPSDVTNRVITTAQAADELLNIKGIHTSFVLCEDGDGVLISARSLGNTNVQMIMEILEGGGHQTVAGARILGETLENAILKLKEAINKYLEVNI